MSTDFFSSQQVFLFLERLSMTVRILLAVYLMRMQHYLVSTIVPNVILRIDYIHFNVSVEF